MVTPEQEHSANSSCNCGCHTHWVSVCACNVHCIYAHCMITASTEQPRRRTPKPEITLQLQKLCLGSSNVTAVGSRDMGRTARVAAKHAKGGSLQLLNMHQVPQRSQNTLERQINDICPNSASAHHATPACATVRYCKEACLDDRLARHLRLTTSSAHARSL